MIKIMGWCVYPNQKAISNPRIHSWGMNGKWFTSKSHKPLKRLGICVSFHTPMIEIMGWFVHPNQKAVPNPRI